MLLNLKSQDVYNHIEISQVKTGTYNYRMCCSIFAPFINLYSNTHYGVNRKIEEVYKHIDTAIEVCLRKGTLDLKKGGWYSKNCEEVANTRLANFLEFTKQEAIFTELYNMGYTIQVNIAVNQRFVTDLKDDGKINGFLEAENYLSTPIKYEHTFNIRRKNDSICQIIDSVYPVIKGTLIECEFKKMFGIIKDNCRAFI